MCRKSKDKFSRYLQDTNDGANDKLNEIFGEAANSSDDEVGIVLDQAQVGVLKILEIRGSRKVNSLQRRYQTIFSCELEVQ